MTVCKSRRVQQRYRKQQQRLEQQQPQQQPQQQISSSLTLSMGSLQELHTADNNDHPKNKTPHKTKTSHRDTTNHNHQQGSEWETVKQKSIKSPKKNHHHDRYKLLSGIQPAASPKRIVPRSLRRSANTTDNKTIVLSSSSLSSSFEQFILILIGLPGSGKSTFARSLEQAMPHKFVRINQDELKTRKACEEKTKQVLKSGKCPIIDRCNFDKAQRDTWRQLASSIQNSNATETKTTTTTPTITTVIPVDAIVFQHISIEECIRRCEQRSNHETVKPEEAAGIVRRVRSNWQLPRLRNVKKHEKESYRSYWNIRDERTYHKAFLFFLNRK